MLKKGFFKRIAEIKSVANIRYRVYLLFGIIVALFIILAGRLAYMQLYNKAFYDDKLEASSTYVVKDSLIRGEIYDAAGTALASNEVKEVVAFTRSNTITAKGIRDVAQELASIVDLTETEVSDRDKKDYYLADTKTYQKLVEDMPNEAKYDSYGNALSDTDLYTNAVDYVPKDKINYSEEELKAVYIFNQMNAAQNFNTVNLSTSTLTDEQKAIITARQSKLEGISIRESWNRNETTSSLASILGKVSSEKTGLPAEEAEEYLKKGYTMNDRVGTSFLEKQYEEVLHGEHYEKEVVLDKSGSIESEKVISEGTNGKTIQITIDSTFQAGVEDILQNYFNSELAAGSTAYSEGVYAVALDPNTGAVLAMAGYDHDIDSGEMTKNALGTITEVFTPGSVVKGATIATAYKNGKLDDYEYLYDQTIYLDGVNPINSWFTEYGYSAINAIQALEYSSNTFMAQLALRMMEEEYQQWLILEDLDYDLGMKRLREGLGDFGLGVSTGIDLPGESTGLIPENYSAGDVITESFGQFDNYTTLQLAQYASTVANGGTRYAPFLVQGIYEQTGEGMGNLVSTYEPKVLNTIDITDEQMSIIKEGFYQVVNNNSSYTTGTAMQGASWTISAKTGTAESYVTFDDGSQLYTTNLNVVGYAPSTDPKIAVAVTLPHETNYNSKASHQILKAIVNLYASLYKGSGTTVESMSSSTNSNEDNQESEQTSDEENNNEENSDFSQDEEMNEMDSENEE